MSNTLINWRKKYSLNEDYFHNINTPDKAYWLGFLIADGSLALDRYAVRLDLATKDRDQVVKFQKAIGSNHRIYDNHNGISKLLAISNKIFYNNLSKHFVKTKIPRINRNYIRHFVRGIFDGDGCIMCYPHRKSKIRISILGSENMLKEIQSQSPISRSNRINKVGGIFETRMDGQKAVDFLNWIYKDSEENNRLERKYKKYKSLTQRYREVYKCKQ